MTTQYPLIASLVVARKSAFDVARSIREPDFSTYESNPTEYMKIRTAYRKAGQAAEASRDAVDDAYASEMLPAVLDGEWVRTQHSIKVPKEERSASYYFGSRQSGLIDHPRTYRRRGSRGMITLKCAVCIAHFYNVFGRGEDRGKSISQSMRDEATSLCDMYQVSVWVRPDLSSWFPDWTCVVLCGRGLPHNGAEEFGFIALAQAPATP
jgi:hypothetical protein